MIKKIKNNFMERIFFLFLIGVLFPYAAFAKEEAADPKVQMVTLGALDKISARLNSLDVRIGEKIRFGTLEITVLKCRKNPPEETPETTAFLIINDFQNDGTLKPVFKGWMFASSPALSPLEHGVYDVWVTNCKMVSVPKPAGIE
jgi:hypothetical protein